MTSKPMLCRVPSYLLPGIAQAHHQFPHALDVRRPRSAGAARGHSSFSLRSGLMTSGCVGRLALGGRGRLGRRGPGDDVDQQQVGVGVDGHALGQASGRGRGCAWSTCRSLTSIRIESGIAPARQVTLTAVDQLLEHAPLGDAGGRAPDVEPDLGLDRLLGADPGEVEVDDLLAQVVPLHVAHQDRLGRPARGSSSARWVDFLIISQTASRASEIGTGACLCP